MNCAKYTLSVVAMIFFSADALLPRGDHKQQALRFSSILTAKGYTVQAGVYGFFTPDRCTEIDDCYANNPSSPYGLIFLPPGVNEDVTTNPNWGMPLSEKVNGSMYSASYRLEANETIVLLGQTPPRSLYYSYVPYIFDRWYPQNWSSPSTDIMGKCPTVTAANGLRCRVFASLGDPISMQDINCSSLGGESFSSSFAHFMGGDTTQVELLKETGILSGISEDLHNTFALSSDVVDFGVGREGDGILHLLRMAFTDPAQNDEYVLNPQDFYSVLRVTPPVGTPGPPFPPNIFKARVPDEEVVGSTLSHAELQTALSDDLWKGVMSKLLPTHPFVHTISVDAPNFDDGYDCLKEGTICNGDNQDTLYPNSARSILTSGICNSTLGSKCPIARRTTLQADGSDFFLVTGVNHNATGSALYSSMCMYNYARLESIGAFTSMPLELDNASYVGSAKAYAKYLSNASYADYLYAIKVTRKCSEGEPYCVEIPGTGPNSLPDDGSCLFIERIYLDQMRAGPTRDATVKPIVYHFSPKVW